MTVEETLILSMNHKKIALRTNRLIELYQHLMSYFTGRRNAVGAFNIAHFDYVNVRRSSRDLLKGVLSEEYLNEVGNQDDNVYILPSPINSPRPDRHSPHQGYERVRSPPLPPIGSNTHKVVVPKPPPKPRNAKEILHEFKNLHVSSVEEPVYKTVYTRESSAHSTGSIYTDMETLMEMPGSILILAEDEPPDLPPTPAQYADFSTLGLEDLSTRVYANFNPNVEYVNVPKKEKCCPFSPRSHSEPEVVVRKVSNPSRPLRNSTIVPFIDEDEMDSELYDTLYSLKNNKSDSDPLEILPARRSGVYSRLTRNGLTSSPERARPPATSPGVSPAGSRTHTPPQNSPKPIRKISTRSGSIGDIGKQYTENFMNKVHILEKRLSKQIRIRHPSIDTDSEQCYSQGYEGEWAECVLNTKKEKLHRTSNTLYTQ